jgi:hypothetical protein
MPKTNPCALAFTSLLVTPSNNNLLLLEGIAQMTALMLRAKEQTLAAKTSEHYLEWVPTIEKAFEPELRRSLRFVHR